MVSAPHRACSLSQTGAEALCMLEPLTWVAHQGRLLLACVGLQSPRGITLSEALTCLGKELLEGKAAIEGDLGRLKK